MEHSEQNPLIAQTSPEQSDDNLFFPSIQATSQAENEAIEALLNAQSTPQAQESDPTQPADAEESVCTEATLDDNAPNPNAEPLQSPAEAAVPHQESTPGLLSRLKEKYAKNAGKRTASYALVTIGLVILLALVFCLMGTAYLLSTALLLVCALALMCVCIALIVACLAGLCYGLILLFGESIAVALLEIGLSLTVSGIIIALSALSNELATGQLPRLIRAITHRFVDTARKICAYVFGKNASPEQEVSE